MARSTHAPALSWKVSWLRLLFILHFTFYLIHSTQSQSLVGNWVGVRQEVDSGFVCPLPLHLQVRADSTYTLSLIDNAAAAPRSTWSWRAGTLRLDTATYLPAQVRLTATDLRITGAIPMQFRRVLPEKITVTEAGVRAGLTNRIWQLGQVRYHFHEGGQACVENGPGPDRAIRCWTVIERDGAVFVVVKGNRIDCSRNYEAPIQVLGTSTNQLTVSRFSGDESGTDTFTAVGKLAPGKTCAAVGFQLCSRCFYAPYNQADELDKKGPPGRYYAIRQRLLAGFRPADLPGHTGLVQVRCSVNCEGQAGQFTAITYGADYQQAQLDPVVVNQLLTLLRTHFSDGWQPGRVRAVDRPLDYVATINIRLVRGRITDVFP